MDQEGTVRRRSAEERLADLERKQAELRERLEAQLRGIEEQKQKLMAAPLSRKEVRERQQRFARAMEALAPGWDERHIIAAIEAALGGDAEALQERGEHLLETHGRARRGRRRRAQ